MADPIKKLQIAIRKCVEDQGKTQNMQRHADFTADLIRKRTRLGFGVDVAGGPRRKLKPLSESYKSTRRNEAFFFKKQKNSGEIVTLRAQIQGGGKRHPDLSSRTQPGKSNLTFTNQMLESLKGKATRSFEFRVEPTGTRSDGKTNAEVAAFVESQGRRFLNLSNNELKQLQEILRRDFLDCFRRKLTK